MGDAVTNRRASAFVLFGHRRALPFRPPGLGVGFFRTVPNLPLTARVPPRLAFAILDLCRRRRCWSRARVTGWRSRHWPFALA